SEAPRGTARLNAVLSTRLTLPGVAAGRANEQAVMPGVAADPSSKPREITDFLRQEGGPAIAPGRPPPRAPPGIPQFNDILRQEGPVSAPAPGPAPPAPPAPPPPANAAPGRRPGRIFAALNGVRGTRANAMKVNVFLNHPNPTANTPESDPHLVGSFG